MCVRVCRKGCLVLQAAEAEPGTRLQKSRVVPREEKMGLNGHCISHVECTNTN